MDLVRLESAKRAGELDEKDGQDSDEKADLAMVKNTDVPCTSLIFFEAHLSTASD